MKKRWMILLYLVLPTIGAVLLVEVYLRAFHDQDSNNPWAGYYTPRTLREHSVQYRPSVYARSLLPAVPQHIRARDYTITINSKGYRGPEFATGKPPGTIRIMAYGGSSVFDGEVGDGLDWPALLQARLREMGLDNVEVINAGIPAHGSADSYNRLLLEGHYFSPDYVLAYYGWNDIKEFQESEPMTRTFLPLLPDPLLYYHNALDEFLSETSQVYVRLRQKYWFWRLGVNSEGATKQWRHDLSNWELHPILESPSKNKYGFYDTSVEQFRLNIETFIDVARTVGAEPILVQEARLVAADNDAAQLKEIRYGYVGLDHAGLVEAYRRIDEVVEEVAREKGVLYIPTVAGTPRDLDHFFDHVHLRAGGTRAVAATIARPLFEHIRAAR